MLLCVLLAYGKLHGRSMLTASRAFLSVFGLTAASVSRELWFGCMWAWPCYLAVASGVALLEGGLPGFVTFGRIVALRIGLTLDEKIGTIDFAVRPPLLQLAMAPIPFQLASAAFCGRHASSALAASAPPARCSARW